MFFDKSSQCCENPMKMQAFSWGGKDYEAKNVFVLIMIWKDKALKLTRWLIDLKAKLTRCFKLSTNLIPK